MKGFILFIGLLLTFNNLAAQEKITENTKATGIEEVYVNLKFANNIIVKNWNRNEISVEATVNLDANEHNNYFSFKTDKIGGTYKINSEYGDYFKKYRSYYSHKHYDHDKDAGENEEKQEQEDDCYGHKYSNVVNYVIYVPKNMELKIKSISGNVEAESYTGFLSLDLISGNITVKKHSTGMSLKTISGDIDIFITDAKLEAKTITGAVYSDLEIDLSKKKRNGMGTKIKTTINKGNASLRLNTISGDIFLRKI